jgi:cob(I)alamin adenosyltransferase
MMSKFFTSTGDDGYTGLLGEGRVAKYDPQLEAVGTLDEASAALGLARAICRSPLNSQLLLKVQRDLYHIMAEISATPENAMRFRQIDAGRVTWLETQIDQIGSQVNMPHEFIVPGDSPAGATLALARAVVRRAERRLVLLLHSHIIQNTELLRYLNRLSSLCFVLELLENRAADMSNQSLVKGSES